MGGLDYQKLYELQDEVLKIVFQTENEILDAAHQKAGFSNEELIIRLKSFPKELLQEIKIIDDTFLDDFECDFLKIRDVILSIISK